jgi:hypothetical protein
MTHLYKRTRPFPLNRKRIEKSPFRTILKAKQTIQKYKRGEKIGFTYVSSLKAMGLIPRASGIYEISMKYRGK